MKIVLRYLLLLLIFSPMFCVGQTYVFKSLIGKDNSKIEKELLIKIEDYTGIKGSPYLYEDFRVGYIFYQDSFYNFPQIKYNLVEQSLEILFQGRNRILPSNKINSFALINPYSDEIENYFNTETIKFKEIKLEGFVQKIKAKDYNLFVHHSVFVKKPTENIDFLGEALEIKFIAKNTFYLEQQNWLYLLRNHKDVTKVVNRNQLKKADVYITKNKLKFKRLEDYINLFTYLGTTKSSI